MAHIYLIRHAESEANSQGIYQGQTYDTGLTELGQIQADLLAGHLAGFSFRRIFVSPLKRTRETAFPISQLLGLDPIFDPRIIETNHGLWEGKSKVEIQSAWPEVYASWQNTPGDTRFPSGEPFTDTARRVLDWWEEAISLEGNTLVVTHDNVIRVILANITGVSLNSIWDFKIFPASVSVVGKDRIIDLNLTVHLDGRTGDLAAHAL